MILGSILLGIGIILGWAFSKILHTKENKAELSALQKEILSLQTAKAVAETKFEESKKHLQEQQRILQDAQEKLTTTFQAIAGESLKSNNQAFVELAKQTLEATLQEAKGDMGRKEESIKSIIGPLQDSLKRYEAELKEIEGKRSTAYGSLEAQIHSLITTQQQLQKEAGNLVTALRRPEVRGRYGEVTLRRVAELAGMSDRCDFTEQVTTETEEGRIRPDMIVHLPGEREIVIDSKIALDAYLDAVACEDEDKKRDCLVRHAQQVRRHMKSLSGKNYWDQFENAPEFVIMFMPGEAFLNAALDLDQEIVEDGMKSRVILATPTTLIALLRAIAYGWRQEQITQNAQVVAELGKQLYDRFAKFVEHLNSTGNSLNQTITNFNQMVGSFEKRVLPNVRKFKELGATGNEEIESLDSIEQAPRRLDFVE